MQAVHKLEERGFAGDTGEGETGAGGLVPPRIFRYVRPYLLTEKVISRMLASRQLKIFNSYINSVLNIRSIHDTARRIVRIARPFRWRHRTLPARA